MKIEVLKNKRILILGMGREGKAVFEFLRKSFPKKTLGIGDREKKIKNQISRIKNVNCHLGSNYLKALDRYDVIIKSPGIPIHLPEIEKAFRMGKITSQTEIFLENYPGKVIGITGTKGKSTTATLIYRILKEAGFRVYLGGNIGKPAISFLKRGKKDDVFIYELSCHQLYNLKKSPEIAILLNVYPEHLDYYRDFKEYVKAKSNITRWQGKNDILIYNPKDRIVREIAKKSRAQRIKIEPEKYSDILKNIRIKFVPEVNLTAAIEVAELFGISREIVKKAIKKFKTLPHRLEFVGEFRGIKFYNDSLSTIPEATIFALNQLKGKVETLILGGQDRQVDFEKLAKRILKSKIKNLLLFPPSGERFWREFFSSKKNNRFRVFLVQNMKDAVGLGFQYTGKEKVCLLSPASPSFGIFKDYKERGNLFKKYIKRYAEK